MRKGFKVISFNAQSIWSKNSIQDIFQLVENACEKSFFCLQEVSVQMQEKLKTFVSKKGLQLFSSGENVILIPLSYKTKRLADIELPYQKSPLVLVDVQLEGEKIVLLSGKLTHGIFFTRTILRILQLKIILSKTKKIPFIAALDANAPSRFEQWYHDSIAKDFGFGVTKNNITYILERIEDKNIAHIFAKFWGKVFKTKNELDRMFFRGVKLLETRVHENIVSSDHIPLTSIFHFHKAK